MKIRIEFTNEDKANVISHANDLNIEEGFAEKVEAIVDASTKTICKQASFEYNSKENFIEINISQILMNKISGLVGKICKQVKPIMGVINMFIASVKDDLESICEEADSDCTESEEETIDDIKKEFDC